LEIVSAEEKITILLGDINEWLVYGRPLRWLHARFGHCKAERTYPARFPVFALDRIWVHPRSALRRFEALSTDESRAASDHLPVRAEIVLPGSGVSRDLDHGASLTTAIPAPEKRGP
jgi:endonuclease/exonuclease/phosphatase family metal-dependent hydrolase